MNPRQKGLAYNNCATRVAWVTSHKAWLSSPWHLRVFTASRDAAVLVVIRLTCGPQERVLLLHRSDVASAVRNWYGKSTNVADTDSAAFTAFQSTPTYLVERQIPDIHQNRSVFEASMKLCTGVDPSKESWKKYPHLPPTYSCLLVAAIFKFNMAAILDLFSAITPKLRQVKTFCLLLSPHFKGQGIPQNPLDVAVMAAILNSKKADMWL